MRCGECTSSRSSFLAGTLLLTTLQSNPRCAHHCGTEGGHGDYQKKVKMGLACGCEFCWICEKEYVNGSHQCNSVRKEKGAVSQGKKGDFQYLAHYYKRYKAHDDGKKFDEDNQVAAQECCLATRRNTLSHPLVTTRSACGPPAPRRSSGYSRSACSSSA